MDADELVDQENMRIKRMYRLKWVLKSKRKYTHFFNTGIKCLVHKYIPLINGL